MNKRKRGMAMLIVIVAMVVLSSFGVLMTTNVIFVQHKVAVSASGNYAADAIGEYFVSSVKKLSTDEQKNDVYAALTAENDGAFLQNNSANPYSNYTVYSNNGGENDVPQEVSSRQSDYLVIGNSESGCYLEVYTAKIFKLRVELTLNNGVYKISRWTYVKQSVFGNEQNR